ncbi:MAG: response regulator [Gammaproteobacteria bacterium]|nr:response regulator [Gammaproteobacteria bacterium]
MKKLIILIADDDRLVRAMIAGSLRANGFSVIEASDGQQAVDLARGKSPDLALLDINMPNMTGIEAASILKNELNIYSVMLTAYDDKTFIEKAVDSGALGYLVKPLEFSKILPTIETALKQSVDLNRLEKSNNNLISSLEKNRNISLAVGILMEKHSVSEAMAFDSLRNYARSNRSKVLDVANKLVGLVDEKSNMANEIFLQHLKDPS